MSTVYIQAGAEGKPGGSAAQGVVGTGQVSWGFFLRFLWKYARPYRKNLSVALLASLPMASAAGAAPWIFKKVTQMLETQAELLPVLTWLVIGLLIMLARNFLEIVNQYIMTVLHVRIMNDMRVDLYRQIHEGSLDLHVRTRTGEIASLVSNDVSAAAGGVIQLFTAFWLNPLLIICLVGVMIYFNFMLAVLVIVSMPILTLVVTHFGRKAQNAERSFLDSQGNMLGTIIESLTNVKQIKSFSLERLHIDKIIRIGEELVRQRKKAVFLQSAASPISDLTNGIALIGMVVLAYYQVSQGLTTIGAVVGCLAAAYSIKNPVKQLSRAVVELQRGFAAVQRITWLFNQLSETGREEKLEARIKTISFRDVGFSYDGRRPVLTDINIEIKQGQRIAVIGPSGSGKTTLVDLLIGFYPSGAGMIYINNKAITDISVHSLREQIGIVTQEPFLFDTTIEENIRYGCLEATPEEILAAARLAGCEEIIDRLPDGMHSTVGERGERLSGGERKRIALARALVRPISVLILDEATSELDTGTEKGILESVDKLAGELIVIHISHRRSIMEHSDRIMLLENGRLREVAPEELSDPERNNTGPLFSQTETGAAPRNS
ncbi:MAG: ABC transporter ATP-binding protein/permease [Proteobacteria bacterium]|nr:ABC transporter ATP-binding protein/permease [Pseudomonadota bacterium]MBU1708811.1 ABC transporter ATP-binding protein/permease [Pseudomonadota bacterium]